MDEPHSTDPPDSPDLRNGEEYKPSPLVRRVAIPRLFESVEKEAPFAECLQCGRNLLDSDCQYVIEKVFRGTEAIIELAMCLNCRDQSSQSMSAESAEAMQIFFDDRVNFSGRIHELLAQTEPGNDATSIDDWVDRCLFSGQPRSEMREYQIVALCAGKEVIRDFFPIMISGEVIKELADVLSDETKGWMDDFIETNFGMPPEFCEPPEFRPVLI